MLYSQERASLSLFSDSYDYKDLFFQKRPIIIQIILCS